MDGAENEMTEGATIYLPVFNPGALLYIGDGHALQGDGELNGNALDTSMAITISDLIYGNKLGFPRVETSSQIVAFVYSGNFDDAFKDAPSNMAEWLMDTYRLNASEVGQPLGVASQYRITEVADRDSGVALKIDKALLANLHVGRWALSAVGPDERSYGQGRCWIAAKSPMHSAST